MPFIITFGSEFSTTTIITTLSTKKSALIDAWEKMFSIFGQDPEHDCNEMLQISKMRNTNIQMYKLWGAGTPVQRNKHKCFQGSLSINFYEHSLKEISQITLDEYDTFIKHKEILNIISTD